MGRKHNFIFPSIYPSIHLSIHPSIYLSTYLSIYLSIYVHTDIMGYFLATFYYRRVGWKLNFCFITSRVVNFCYFRRSKPPILFSPSVHIKWHNCFAIRPVHHSLNFTELLRLVDRDVKRIFQIFCVTREAMYIWLVVDLPLWKIWKSVGIILPKIWRKNMFQTTNQILCTFLNAKRTASSGKTVFPFWLTSGFLNAIAMDGTPVIAHLYLHIAMCCLHAWSLFHPLNPLNPSVLGRVIPPKQAGLMQSLLPTTNPTSHIQPLSSIEPDTYSKRFFPCHHPCNYSIAIFVCYNAIYI